MAKYCFVEAGVIEAGPKTLPANWKNISGLNGLSDEDLLPIGWYPYRQVRPDLPGEYYYLNDIGMVVEATEVVHTWEVVQQLVDDIKTRKFGTLDSAVVNQQAYDEDFEGKKTDASEWSQEKMVALEPLTERVDVEAFDEVIPAQVPVPARRASEVMLAYAEAYLTRDDFRTTVGASHLGEAIKTIVHDWMKDNYDAIDNGTAAVRPPEEIRQHVRVPGEQRQRFLLRRREWDGNHGFRAWVAGGDVTDLAVKVYNAGGTELFELAFVADGDTGRWVCETGAGQRSAHEIEFGFKLVWSDDGLHRKVTMPVGKSQYDVRSLRFGGV